MTYTTDDGSTPVRLAIGDVNNDSRPDIVVSNNGADRVGIVFGYGEGIFSQQLTFPAGNSSQPFAVGIGDFDKDN